ncbi:hypothetical protein ACWGGS_29790 [Streptomyces decoyicus]
MRGVVSVVTAARARRRAAARRHGPAWGGPAGRIVAVGTAAVRALDSATGADGRVRAAAGWTDGRVRAATGWTDLVVTT